jgi:hypothetical protein
MFMELGSSSGAVSWWQRPSTSRRRVPLPAKAGAIGPRNGRHQIHQLTNQPGKRVGSARTARKLPTSHNPDAAGKAIPLLTLQPHPAMIECVIVLALLTQLIATEPESGESCSSR